MKTKKLVLVAILASLILSGCITDRAGNRVTDWQKVSSYYHNFLYGLKVAAPMAITVAELVRPESKVVIDTMVNPILGQATVALDVLDKMIAANASNQEIQAQVQVVDREIIAANAVVGQAQVAK